MKINKQEIEEILDEQLNIINSFTEEQARGNRIKYQAYIDMIRLMGRDVIVKDGKHKLIG